MNIELLKDEMKAARDRITKERQYIADAEMEIAIHACPFAIGDRVVAGDGSTEVIASISYCSWRRANYDFKTYRLKKSGEPYKIANHCYGTDKYTLAVQPVDS